MTQHTLLLDGVVYQITPVASSKYQWWGVLGPLGTTFSTEAEALTWIELMLKYELKGRGQIFLKCSSQVSS